jgi:hypothetical protein
MKEIYGTVELDDTLELEEGFYALTYYGYYIGDLIKEDERGDSVLDQVSKSESF